MAGSRTLKLSILADVDDLKKKLNEGSTEVEGFAGKLEKFGKMAAAAFAAAAAAAAAYATKVAVDGVKAAIEDEAAQIRLATSLRNTTDATNAQIKAVEDHIYKLELAYGVSDNKLRPAFQRLATSTNDLTTANRLLDLALNISAATGKDLEAVSNALGKAYDGNTGALGKLGVGLSAAEMKAMGLEGTTRKLEELFGGAATAQANTFQGQIDRLKITFQETEESIGYALLPTVQKLLDFFINTVIPKFIEFKNQALEPIINAFNRNKESLTVLYNFVKDFIIPIFVNGFGEALKFVAKVAGSILDVIGAVVNGIQSAVKFAIDAINALIRAYNAIPLLPNIPTIPSPTGGGGGGGTKTTIPDIPKPKITGGTSPTGATDIPKPTVTSVPKPTVTTTSSATGVTEPTIYTPAVTTAMSSVARGEYGSQYARGEILTNVTPIMSATQRGEYGITINVNAPSAIDEEGFSRAVVDALNQANDRGTGGAGALRTSSSAL